MPFKRECGLDDVCTTDLKIDAEIVSDLQDGGIIIGQRQILEIMVTVLNKGEASYMTDVMIRLPEQIRFIGAHKYRGHGNVICNPLQGENLRDNGTHNSTVVLCDAGNPMKSRSQLMFKIRLDTMHVLPRVEQFFINMTVKTGSDEIKDFLDDNFINLKIPLRVKTEMTMSG